MISMHMREQRADQMQQIILDGCADSCVSRHDIYMFHVGPQFVNADFQHPYWTPITYM